MLDNKIFKRKKSIAWRTIEGTTFLVNPSTKKMYPLNELGGIIWLYLEELDYDALAKKICNEFDVNSDIVKLDISDFLESLLAEDLIERLS